MKRLILHTLMVAAALLTGIGSAGAQEVNFVMDKADTVCIYKTWENMLDGVPNAMVINPIIYGETPYDIIITDNDQRVREMLSKDVIAVTLGDSIWLMSSDYLKKNFTGDAKKFENFVPFFFNEKVAFVVWLGYEASVGMQILGGLMGDTEMFDSDPYEDDADYYYIDFEKSTVEKVDHKKLSQLLTDYHDLKMRYEGMKDYKKREVMEDYFMRYVDRVTQDPTRPEIVEIMVPGATIE